MVVVTEKNKVSSGRTCQAERKNRREKAQLELRLKLLERDRQRARFLVHKEKKEIFKSLKGVRTTTGVCVEGEPSRLHDSQVVASEYYRRGPLISDQRLTRWRVKETLLARSFGSMNLGLKDEEDESDRQRALRALLDEMRREAGQGESEEVLPYGNSDIEKSLTELYENKDKEPVDVFACLKEEIDNAFKAEVNRMSKKKRRKSRLSVSSNSEPVPPTFTVNSWLDFEAKKYAERVSQKARRPSRVSKTRIRPASAIELGQQRPVDTAVTVSPISSRPKTAQSIRTPTTSSGINIRKSLNTKTNPNISTRQRNKRPLNQSLESLESKDSKDKGSTSSLDQTSEKENGKSEYKVLKKKSILKRTNKEDSFTSGSFEDSDVTEEIVVDLKGKSSDSHDDIILETVSQVNNVHHDTETTRKVRWSTIEQTDTAKQSHDSQAVGIVEGLEPIDESPTELEPYKPLRRANTSVVKLKDEQENTRKQSKSDSSLHRKQGISVPDEVIVDGKVAAQSQNGDASVPLRKASENNRKISSAADRKISHSDRKISVLGQPVTFSSWIPVGSTSGVIKRIEHKPLVRRVSFERDYGDFRQKSAPERKISVRSRAVLDKGLGGEVAVQLDSMGMIRTESAVKRESVTRKESSSKQPNFELSDSRTPQWRREMLKEAPPGFSGDRVRINVAFSKSERKRQLERMVEDHVSNLKEVILTEKDRRLQSRQAILESLSNLDNLSLK